MKKNNEFCIGFVNIGLKNVAVAATRVVDLPPRGVKSVDVYKTSARIIFPGIKIERGRQMEKSL